MTKAFVKRQGKQLIDTHNNTFILRGVGLGSWLYREGYMLKSFNQIDRQRRFDQLLDETVGEAFRYDFNESFYQNFFGLQDILLIKKAGFNSIRIPLDYEFLFEASETTIKLKKKQEHWRYLDDIIALCKKQELYVILDLHAAPGGQTGTNIDNSKNDQPELFIHQRFQDQTVYIWQSIAKHYQDETIVACYDLLNEPLPKWFDQYNEQLMPLYKRIIAAIRTVDPNHLITIEGTIWSTDWSLFDELPDENIMLQFHKYWSSPSVESIQSYIDKRDQLNVPIYMGEGGENNLPWYAAIFKMYEQLDISYCFWTYKKMSSHNCIISFKEPNHWQAFLERKLTRDESMKVLNQLLESIKFDSCRMNESVIHHIMNRIPFMIDAFGFDYLGKEISYHSVSKKTGSIRQTTNLMIADVNQKVIEADFKQYGGEEVPLEKRLYLYLEAGEWVTFTFSGSDKCYLKLLGQNTDNLRIYSDQKELFQENGRYTITSNNKTTTIKMIAYSNLRLDVLEFNYHQ